MRITMNFMTVFIIVILALSATHAVAKEEVYRWVDENGVVHYGNMPDGHANAELIKIHKNPNSHIIPLSQPESTDTSQQQDPEPSYAQQQRDERAKKHKEAVEKKAFLAAACEQQHLVVTTLEPMTRVLVHREDGTVVRMDDNDRLEKLHTAKTYIAENCRK